MTLENQVRPVVTVAAFDPMNDQVVVLKRSQNARVNPGLYEVPGGKVEELDGDLLDRIIEEVKQEIAGKINKEHLVSLETIAIRRGTRTSLLSYRYSGALQNSSNLTIPPEETHEHPEFRFVSPHNFHTLEYVPEVREFLARLFAEQRRTGTLLSTLKQPVYVRPTFLDFEGEQALIPLDEHKAGQPKTYLREDERHISEVLGEIVHTYLGERRRHAQVIRMNVRAKKLVHGQYSIPTWILDYGIIVEPNQAKSLAAVKKVFSVKAGSDLKFPIHTPKSYSAKVKLTLEEMRGAIAETILTATEPHDIRFSPATKHSRDFR